MPRQKRKDKPILLNLPVPLLERVDHAVRETGVSRSRFLRQSVERNLNHYTKHERAVFARLYEKGMA